MSYQRTVKLLCLLAITWGQSCAQPLSLRNSETLVITGSSTVFPLVDEIADRYEIEHPNVQIDIEAGGSSQGLNDARQGHADIGMVSRQLVDSEQDLQAFPIALDGVSVLLHKENPVQELTHQQIIDIYTDKINNWQDVGGSNTPIVVLNRPDGKHSTQKVFENYFKLSSDEVVGDRIISGTSATIAAVKTDPNAIGYVSIGTAEYELVHGAPIKLLPIEGVLPTIANVANGTFPVTRPLNLVVTLTPSALTQDFLLYAQSEAVEDLVKEYAFIPIETSDHH